MTVDAVVWHDVECGAYAADLVLWRSLADDQGGAVLDLGAGTGRVALDLARHGHEVHALDVDPVLLGALEERATDLPVITHVADARDFDLGRRFGLVLAPMQTVQLLGGSDERASMLAAVRRHLDPGGLFAAALANVLEGYDGEDLEVPVPDMAEVEGTLFSSRPTAIRDAGDAFVLERMREKVAPSGERSVAESRIMLHRCTAAVLAAEGTTAGLHAEPPLWIAPTEDHVGSEVVMLRG
jgi:SAM-dependent methyltransferase